MSDFNSEHRSFDCLAFNGVQTTNMLQNKDTRQATNSQKLHFHVLFFLSLFDRTWHTFDYTHSNRKDAKQDWQEPEHQRASPCAEWCMCGVVQNRLVFWCTVRWQCAGKYGSGVGGLIELVAGTKWLEFLLSILMSVIEPMWRSLNSFWRFIACRVSIFWAY